MNEMEIKQRIYDAIRSIGTALDMAKDVCSYNDNILSSDDQYYDITMSWCYEVRDSLTNALDELNRSISAMDN